MRRRLSLASLLIAFLSLLPLRAAALAHEARIPLHDGHVRLADFSDKLLSELHCPTTWLSHLSLPGSIDCRNLDDSTFVDALNNALGDACRLSVDHDSLILHVDREKLPNDWDGYKLAARVFTAYAAPENTAAQQRLYGLQLPSQVDPRRPMVILVHGLDCNAGMWGTIAGLLDRDGYQVAFFNYPAAQHIPESARLLADHVEALRETYPTLKLDVITHSMGGLVARDYVEGPRYAGGIDHLIQLTPPNHGSGWAHVEFLLKCQSAYYQCRSNPDWRWTWMITDGIGEAADDLIPKSKFLKDLNARPRRDGVAYTIVAGNRNPAWETAGDIVNAPSRWFPTRIENWWGIRHTRHGLQKAADKLRTHDAGDDGPVSVKSTKLDGVTDYVLLPVDHVSVYAGSLDNPPAAWPIIRDRLAR